MNFSPVSIIKERIVGIDESSLKIFIANAFSPKPNATLLVGKHGLGKTTIVNTISKLLGAKYVCYDMSKCDLLNIAGMPNMKKISEGSIEYIHHKNTIWDAEVVFFNELNRCTSDNMNLLLEILQEKTLFGEPLQRLNVIIADCNPDYYAGAEILDEALKDRFSSIIQLKPSYKYLSDIIRININPDEYFGNRKVSDSDLYNCLEFKEIFNTSVKRTFDDKDISKAFNDWATYVIKEIIQVFKETGNYISPRRAVNMVQVMLTLYAYDKITKENIETDDILWNAVLALKYCLLNYFENIPVNIVQEILKQAKKFIVDYAKKVDMNISVKGSKEKFRCINSGTTESRVAAFINGLNIFHSYDENDKAALEINLRNFLTENIYPNIKENHKHLYQMINFLKIFPDINNEVALKLLDFEMREKYLDLLGYEFIKDQQTIFSNMKSIYDKFTFKYGKSIYNFIDSIIEECGDMKYIRKKFNTEIRKKKLLIKNLLSGRKYNRNYREEFKYVIFTNDYRFIFFNKIIDPRDLIPISNKFDILDVQSSNFYQTNWVLCTHRKFPIKSIKTDIVPTMRRLNWNMENEVIALKLSNEFSDVIDHLTLA